jgi:hypothetical protein
MRKDGDLTWEGTRVSSVWDRVAVVEVIVPDEAFQLEARGTLTSEATPIVRPIVQPDLDGMPVRGYDLGNLRRLYRV